MYKKIFIALIITLVLFPPRAWAKDVCSTSGYTVFTINGMFTGKQEAIDNSNRLKNLLPSKYNNEPIFFDYLYNPSHIAGAGDVVDVVAQTLEEKAGDYDLWKMMDELSKKAKTQKILFVGYSQGNFYANDIFEKITSQNVGVPSAPLGVYSIATPDDHVSKSGLYLTSDTDKIIADFAWYFKKIMPPNTHIELKESDGNGHSFVSVYLKYRSKKIVSDIKSSISKLKVDSTRDKNELCVPPRPEATIIEIADIIIPVMDFLGEKLMKPIIETFNKIKAKIDPFKSLVSENPATALLYNNDINNKSIENVEIINTENKNSEIIAEPEKEIVSTLNQNIILNTENIKENVGENVLEKETKKSHSSHSNKSNDVILEEENDSSVIVPVVEVEDELSNDNGEEEESSEQQGGVTEEGTEEDSSENTEEREEENIEEEEIIDENEDTEQEDTTPEEESDPPQEIVRGGYVYDYDEDSPFFHLEDDRFDIELIGDKIVTLNVGDIYEEKGAKVVDSESFKNTQPQIVGSVDTSKVGIYVIKYRGKEVNAPYTPYVARIVNVIDSKVRDLNDKKPPEVNINGDLMVYVGENFKKYEEKGASASDDNDGNLEVTISDTYFMGIREMQRRAYIASDKSGNLTIKFREILSSDYIYVPRYKFGTENEDGNNWEAWFFDGSLVFDWSDKYINNYLRQEFKIEAQPYPNLSCFNCMSKTIFNKDPTKGFDISDYSRPASVERDVQNLHDGQIYQVVVQWDKDGYLTLVTHGDIVDYSIYTEIENINENMWVGWSASFSSIAGLTQKMWNPYDTFSTLKLGGGRGMVLEPRRVYDPNAVNYEEDDWGEEETGETEEDTGEVDEGEVDNQNEESESEEESGARENTGEESVEEGDLEEEAGEEAEEEGDTGSDIKEDTEEETGEIATDNNPIVLEIKVNSTESSIDVDPISNNPLLEIKSNKNVDWVSIKIENQEDSSLYKMFFSNSDTCVDGTNVCSRTWDGLLSSGGLLKDGLYKVRVHVKDESGIETEEYLNYSINVINQPIL